MSDEQLVNETIQAASEQQTAATVDSESPIELGALDELDNVDFLLEEIENKIAPLALA